MSTMTTDLKVYRLQIMNFLQTLSIKFTPTIDKLNVMVANAGYPVDYDNPQTWKYYINLSGNYHPIDTVMKVISLDTREEIEFTQANLVQHVRTRASYVPGSSYYDALCQKYPQHTDLIKNILTPVTDIDAAIDATDFTILGYDGSFLESSEEGYLVNGLQKTLNYIKTRGYPSYLASEPYFYPSFWVGVWNALVQSCFALRFEAQRTIYVHSWFIWQYLMSRGLGDYSDILTREKAMFFYRCFEYLIQNRGKQSNLLILQDKLLGDLSVGLFARDVYLQTFSKADQYKLTPEFVAREISNGNGDESVPALAMSDMNQRLIEAGDEVDGTAQYVAQMEDTLSATVVNTYPTKILELRPLPRDRKYADFFNVFAMDTLVALINSGKYSVAVELFVAENSETVILSAKDALVLLYYCIHRMSYETPVNIPNSYTSRTAFREQPLPIPPTFKWSGFTYNTKTYVDLPKWQDKATYPKPSFTIATNFSEMVSSMFLNSLDLVLLSRSTSDLVELTAMQKVIESLVWQANFPIDLCEEKTYDEWFGKHFDVYKHFIESFETLTNPQQKYSDLADQILTGLLPVTKTMQAYGNFSISEQGYGRLKDLFISLCSYNVTFLNTTRDVYQFFYVDEMALGTLSRSKFNQTAVPPSEKMDLSSTVTNSIGVLLDDIEVSLATQVKGELSIRLGERLERSTTASNTLASTDAVSVKPSSVAARNAVAVPETYTVTVGSAS